MINKTGNTTNRLENSCAVKNKPDDSDKDLFDDDNEIITSPILLTQANKNETTFKIPETKNDDIIELDNTERCTSPILLTQTEKKKNKTLAIRMNESLVILPSDSDSDDTVIYEIDDNKNNSKDKLDDIDNNKNNSKYKFDDIDNNKNNSNDKLDDIDNNKNQSNDKFDDIDNNKNQSNDKFDDSLFTRTPLTNKRKCDDDNASPLFKKQKVQPVKSLQEKIITALSLNRKSPKKSNDFDINFVVSQKENLTPAMSMTRDLSQKSSSKLDLLQKFRRDKKKMAATPHKIDFVMPKKNSEFKNNLTFDDSDDDFQINDKRTVKVVEEKPIIDNHKVRKKKKQNHNNSLIDLEAQLSGSECSGDELSDESVGSIIDFICDEQEDHPDIQAVYLESVKDHCKGTFKIPQLPTRFDKEQVFSQYVEDNDAYEMDSFCVDSHVGLTQAHDLSELELAERQLEIRKKSRRKRVLDDTASPCNSDNDSPLVKRKNRVRRISSDSE